MGSAPQTLVVATREDMIGEAKAIVDAAREQGIVIRLLGGLAARLYCRSLDFCERDHGDIDLIGHRRDARRIEALFAGLGYQENRDVLLATQGLQLQFVRACRHGDEWSRYRPHDEDHADVFLDTFRLDHAIDLHDRLELDDYAIASTDVLLIKLQMGRLEEKDERDIFTLLQDLPLLPAGAASLSGAGRGVGGGTRAASGGPASAATGGGSPAGPPASSPAVAGTSDAPGAGSAPASGPAIDVAYIARRCAHDWGLFHDVQLNLAGLQFRLAAFAPSPAVEGRVREALRILEQAIEAEPKPASWRLRARIGTKLAWRNPVEEQD